MTLQAAFQMDPIGSIDIDADSTFRIMIEAQRRGHELFYYLPDRLFFNEGQICARGQPVSVRHEHGNHVTAGQERVVPLADFDVVWLRQDPPFDMSYITTTHLLDLVAGETLVVNNPFWVRNFPEKLLVLEFPELIPPTLISRDVDTLAEFRRRHGDIVIKPLFGNGGAGVFVVREGDVNFNSLLEMFHAASRQPVIAQKFLPDISNGDKRVILVDGKPLGAVNRIPAEGEGRSNLHVGGVATRVGLTQRDLEICRQVGKRLAETGQIFAGIDIIGSWLTEINITSPTGIVELERFDGVNAAASIWEKIEEIVGKGTSPAG